MAIECMLRLVRGVSFVALLAAAPAHGQPARPNLVVVLTDDQGAWTVGAYGNPDVSTPNMDRLAREGARFTNAFVATPVCSPSRATFLTGLHATRLGITDYISAGTGFEAAAGLGLPLDRQTWPEVLQKHGYATALVGKWHLGWQPGFHPTRRGFDHFCGFLGATLETMDPTLEKDGKELRFKGYVDDLLTDDAIDFIVRNRSRPFALVLATRGPHLPYGPVPDVDAAPYRDLDSTVPRAPGVDIAQIKNWTREYFASVRSVDRNLGRLLRTLDELDLADRTAVVFTSDNGCMIGHHGLHTKGNAWTVAGGVDGPFRPNMFEESIRVPLAIRWPGAVRPGTELTEFVSNVDLFPSLLGMLGIPVPRGLLQDGMDFSPLLRGRTVPWRDAVFGQYDMHHFSLAFMRMIRTARWKLVRFHFANNMDELYDLEADPQETTNLYYRNRFGLNPDYQSTVQSLDAQLLEWQRSIGDPLLRPEYTPLEPANRRAAHAAASKRR